MADLLVCAIQEYLADHHANWKARPYNVGVVFISDTATSHTYIVMYTDRQKMMWSRKGTQVTNDYTEQTVLQQITDIINGAESYELTGANY